MKLYHYSLLFVIIALTIILISDIRHNNLQAVIKNKRQVDRNIDIAIDDGVRRLTMVDSNNNVRIDKEAAVNSFFISLNSAFGVLADKDAKEKLKLYIPVVAVTMEDGYYIFYSDEYTDDKGYTYTTKRWSEKLPYYYEDEDFIYGFTLGDVVNLYDKNNLLTDATGQQVLSLDYHDIQRKREYSKLRSSRPDSILLDEEAFELVRKGAIINCLEEAMAYHISRHNKIAVRNGISYNFSLPGMNEEDWAPYVDDIGMFVVFQGYPFGTGVGEVYNRIAAAGAKVSKRETYYMEQKGWYLIYHRNDCSELELGGLIMMDEPLVEESMAYSKGAYQCPICFPNGIHAPDYIFE